MLSFIRWEGFGGAIYHFVTGGLCAFFFALHICIHRKWIKATTKLCFTGKLSKALRWKYIVDVLLFAVWGISIVTGFITMSPFLSDMENISPLGRLHGITARFGLALIVIHLIQHIPQIKSYLKIKNK